MLETLRLAIYRHLLATGGAPSNGELARAAGCGATEVERGLRALAEEHAIVLMPGSLAIAMAHPFSAIPTAYRVHSAGVSYWANCAWDALGIAAIVGRDTESQARCGDCEEQVDLSVRDGAPAATSGVIHLLVPARRFWDDIGFT